jgi:hypothetical protein
VANENYLMVLVRARQRKRQSMGSFAQEDIPEGSKSNPGNREMSRGNRSLVETIVAAVLGTCYLSAGWKESFKALAGATHRQRKGLFRLRAKNLLMGQG